jgi:hypothetical protein
MLAAILLKPFTHGVHLIQILSGYEGQRENEANFKFPSTVCCEMTATDFGVCRPFSMPIVTCCSDSQAATRAVKLEGFPVKPYVHCLVLGQVEAA